MKESTYTIYDCYALFPKNIYCSRILCTDETSFRNSVLGYLPDFPGSRVYFYVHRPYLPTVYTFIVD